jgi:hypothetical protein
VHDHDLSVLRHADVELEHVRAGAQRLAKGVHRVGRELVLAALMGDVERGALLDPGIGGLRGRDQRSEGDQQNGQHAAHCREAISGR